MVDVLAKIDRLLKIVLVSLFISLYVLFDRVSSLSCSFVPRFFTRRIPLFIFVHGFRVVS